MQTIGTALSGSLLREEHTTKKVREVPRDVEEAIKGNYSKPI
jgi:hypothetical protein